MSCDDPAGRPPSLTEEELEEPGMPVTEVDSDSEDSHAQRLQRVRRRMQTQRAQERRGRARGGRGKGRGNDGEAKGGSGWSVGHTIALPNSIWQLTRSHAHRFHSDAQGRTLGNCANYWVAWIRAAHAKAKGKRHTWAEESKFPAEREETGSGTTYEQ